MIIMLTHTIHYNVITFGKFHNIMMSQCNVNTLRSLH
jgi:hypothetical protein